MKSLIYLLSAFSILISSTGFAKPAQIILLRHAEKPTSGPDLSPVGVQRAEALAVAFQTRPELKVYNGPTALIASARKSSVLSNRPAETLDPTARVLNLRLIENLDPSMTQELAQSVLNDPKYDGKMIVICWTHSEIPTIADLLAPGLAPQSWAANVFDRFWIFNFDANGRATFSDVPQNLLPGDSKL